VPAPQPGANMGVRRIRPAAPGSRWEILHGKAFPVSLGLFRNCMENRASLAGTCLAAILS